MDSDRASVLVVGDAMLDRYVSGECTRISPEAPVPVLLERSTRSVPGGAANVAMNLVSLGCRTTLVAGIGRDAAGRELKRLVRTAGIRTHFDERSDAVTTVKTRFVIGGKQLLRVDRETDVWTRRLAASEEDVADSIRRDGGVASTCAAMWTRRLAASDADVLVLSDYNKGFLSPAVCRDWIATASERGIPVLVDPKGTDWTKYAGATCVKPNRAEFAAMTGLALDVKSESARRAFERTAKKLCRRFSLKSLLVTLGADGMALVGATCVYLPSQAREVYDVSGAGDTAIAAFAAALGAGKAVEEAMRMANAAAGIAVSKVGTSVVTSEELADAEAAMWTRLSQSRRIRTDKFHQTRLRQTRPQETPRPRGKILSLADCVRAVERLRAEGKRIGFTNGCFDCCHLGHIHSIREARSLCDVLVVGVNSDVWIRRHKGAGRPIQDERTRTTVLAAMADVDFVVVFGDETAERLVRAIRPDVIAKEGYPRAKWPEGRLVEQMGGRAVSLKRVEGYSTTALAERMRNV